MSDDAVRKSDDKPRAIADPTSILKTFFTRGMSPFVSFDPTTEEGGALFLKAQLGEVEDLQTMIGKDIYVKHVMCHDAGSTDNNSGEYHTWTRTVLVDAEGKMYQCGSDGVLKSLDIFKAMKGRLPPWDPPIKVTVTMQKLGPGKQWMTLLPDMRVFSANFKRPGKG